MKPTGDAMRGQLGTLRRQLFGKIDRLFAPREILLRSADRVKYIRISRRQQVTAAALASGVAGWMLLATAGVVGAALFIPNGGKHHDETAAAYAQLREQINVSRASFAEVLQAVSANAEFSLNMAGDDLDATGAGIEAANAFTGRGAPDDADAALAALRMTSANLAAMAAHDAALSRDMQELRQRFLALGESHQHAAIARDRFAASWRASEQQLAVERSANVDLQEQLAVLQTEIAALEYGQADGLAERQSQDLQIAALADNLATAAAENKRLQDTVTGMQQTVAQIAALTDSLAAVTAQNERLQDAVTGMQRTVALIANDRTSLRASRDDMSSQVTFLENRMSSLQATQQTIVQKLTERTRGTVAEVEKTVLMTGLDLEDLLKAAAGLQAGEGGPFVPAVRSMRSAEERRVLASIQKLDGEVDRWARLQLVLRGLPLASPLDSYLLMSGFGERRDPFNGKMAFHEGVDLKNEIGTPVLATAPGTVVYAGWMGDYGRTVEIDHGLGIHTRYAHLKSIAVKVGEKVDFRQEIGKLGRSGRSTGPHVHYEVQVNGKPHDPMNFMEAGKYVFKG